MEDMSQLTEFQQKFLSNWQRHGEAEFLHFDPHAAIDTMGENPYIMNIPFGRLVQGREEVFNFYKYDMMPNVPEDFAMVPLHRVLGANTLMDELLITFTHSCDMPWTVPGVPPTGKKVEMLLMVATEFDENGLIKFEHLMWDHMAVLAQLGVLDHPLAQEGLVSPAKMLKLCGYN